MSEATATRAELDKGYEPAKVEAHWAAWWEEQGFFRSQDESDKPPFSIVQPPPNVTGSLHLGHALTATMEDVLARWKRMSGFNVCWLPGIDHAGIATQMVVERELQKREKKSRHDLGREEFLRRVWAWKEESGGRIALQHRALGASLDWDRLRFTMDEQSSRAVREAFVRLYEDGLLYRAERLINWCVKDGTALSDLEVDHEEGVKGELYRFAYPLADGSGEIVVATTRPETMLGDTAIAVHPDDGRYRAMVGKNVRHPIVGRELPIVADAELVDPKFGTGAVKVTPAHSFEDFESGKRHQLPLINILNLDGTLNQNAGPFQGQDRIKVRPALKARLAELGLERGSEPHTMALGRCQRCNNIVEPMLSKQWFVKTTPLAAKVIARVDEMQFVPGNWRAEFLRWMNEHPRLVRLPPALVGPPDPRLVLRERPRQRGSGEARRLRPVQPAGPHPGPGRARHLVLLGPLALLHLRLAGRDQGAAHVLSQLGDGDGLRHPLLLGRAHGHARRALHGRGALPHRLPARDGPRREGREDVEDAGQRHRPARAHREVRRRCAALHPRLDGGSGPRHQARNRAHRGLPRLRQQDLERGALRAHECGAGAGRARPCRGAPRLRLRPVDPLPLPALRRPDPGLAGAPGAERRRQRHLQVRLERALRLGHRAVQAGSLRREVAAGAGRGALRPAQGAGGGAAALASLHALRHRGDLAAAAEPQRAQHHARALSRPRPLPPRRRRRAGDGPDLRGPSTARAASAARSTCRPARRSRSSSSSRTARSSDGTSARSSTLPTPATCGWRRFPSRGREGPPCTWSRRWRSTCRWWG